MRRSLFKKAALIITVNQRCPKKLVFAQFIAQLPVDI
jgi:hypothetical protein